MKNKKGLIILSSVVGVCALGLVISPLMDWNVDNGSTSGNIGKTSRFSRKAEASAISNMEELILNDPSYKNGIVASYMVMGTRAQQFEALVNMSNEAAGDIPEFSKVLKEMNDVAPMISNVCASLAQAGNDLSGALANEPRPDLAQNVMNASLAYTTLQKQNKLASQFIDTTDKYLRSSEGTDALKLVRDQWVDYQQMTAALDGDEKASKELTDKGYLLTPEQSVAALKGFTASNQLGIVSGVSLSKVLNVSDNLSQCIVIRALESLELCSRVPSIFINSMEKNNLSLQDVAATDMFNEMTKEVMAAVFDGNVNDLVKPELAVNSSSNVEIVKTLSARENVVLAQGPFIIPFADMGGVVLMDSFKDMVVKAAPEITGLQQNTRELATLNSICDELGAAISSTAQGKRFEPKIY
ncbi:MAG: hypothetical protein IKG92_09455 [Bacteroidales bacterium]|nr:hypothetical protein [Bacteroidales bacterium]